jgi:hypothetical protein
MSEPVNFSSAWDQRIPTYFIIDLFSSISMQLIFYFIFFSISMLIQWLKQSLRQILIPNPYKIN